MDRETPLTDETVADDAEVTEQDVTEQDVTASSGDPALRQGIVSRAFTAVRHVEMATVLVVVAVVALGAALVLYGTSSSSGVPAPRAQSGPLFPASETDDQVVYDLDDGAGQESKKVTVGGTGTYTVGVDIPGGVYASASVPQGCTYSLSSGAANVLPTVPAELRTTSAQELAAVRDGEIFTTEGCGEWQSINSLKEVSTFGDGIWVVPKQISGASLLASGGPACRWGRLKDFNGTPESVESDIVVSGPTVGVIYPENVGFFSYGCGTWTVRDGGTLQPGNPILGTP